MMGYLLSRGRPGPFHRPDAVSMIDGSDIGSGEAWAMRRVLRVGAGAKVGRMRGIRSVVGWMRRILS